MADFEVYRSRQNRHHYVAVHAGDEQPNAQGVRDSRNLEFLLKVPDDGATRIAFEADAARERIARHGFYAFAVTIEVRESVEG